MNLSAKHILVVDDERHILDVVVYVLEQHGFTVSTAEDGETALDGFSRSPPDLVILDLGLPGISGLDLFRELRRCDRNLPVIMLTSRSDEVDRVVGLELGADDYVTKPFSPRELVARVKNVFRRAGQPSQAQEATELSLGPFELDPDSFSLKYFGHVLEVTRSELLLLECLVRYPARVFTRDALIDHIYDGEHIVTDRSIDACVKRVRRKLVQVRDDFDPIQTVYGMGYKLHPDCESVS